MSHETVSRAAEDEALLERVTAAAQKEALNSPTLSGTPFAVELRKNPSLARVYFAWPVAIDYESEYEYAIDQGNENPGGDEGVITDANITAAVGTHWPGT